MSACNARPGILFPKILDRELMYMFDYNIYTDNSHEKFKETCKKIEQAYPSAIKKELLVDVDGSTIQTYTEKGRDIDVYDDYDVGAVFVKSEIDLDKLFRQKHL